MTYEEAGPLESVFVWYNDPFTHPVRPVVKWLLSFVQSL